MSLAIPSGIICLVCLVVVSVAWRQEMRANNEKAKRERKRRERVYKKQNSFKARIARHQHKKNLQGTWASWFDGPSVSPDFEREQHTAQKYRTAKTNMPAN